MPGGCFIYSLYPFKILEALRSFHFQQLAFGLGSKCRAVRVGLPPSFTLAPRPPRKQGLGTLCSVWISELEAEDKSPFAYRAQFIGEQRRLLDGVTGKETCQNGAKRIYDGGS